VKIDQEDLPQTWVLTHQRLCPLQCFNIIDKHKFLFITLELLYNPSQYKKIKELCQLKNKNL
jgi:hypothetical protein